MDSFEFNKIAGAVLGACLGIMVIGKVSNALVHAEIPKEPSIKVATAAQPSAPAAAPQKAPPAEGDDAKAGEAVFNTNCKTCHTAEKGGRTIQGPNLFGIVGNKKAHLEGFKYTKAMLDKGGQWTEEELNEFLFSPGGYVRGTAMAFRGVKNNKERGNLISFLKSLK
jgi:cytochrome c